MGDDTLENSKFEDDENATFFAVITATGNTQILVVFTPIIMFQNHCVWVSMMIHTVL
jgi:hypothetical protein